MFSPLCTMLPFSHRFTGHSAAPSLTRRTDYAVVSEPKPQSSAAVVVIPIVVVSMLILVATALQLVSARRRRSAARGEDVEMQPHEVAHLVVESEPPPKARRSKRSRRSKGLRRWFKSLVPSRREHKPPVPDKGAYLTPAAPAAADRRLERAVSLPPAQLPMYHDATMEQQLAESRRNWNDMFSHAQLDKQGRRGPPLQGATMSSRPDRPLTPRHSLSSRPETSLSSRPERHSTRPKGRSSSRGDRPPVTRPSQQRRVASMDLGDRGLADLFEDVPLCTPLARNPSEMLNAQRKKAGLSIYPDGGPSGVQ